jgi:hypothetical protein
MNGKNQGNFFADPDHSLEKYDYIFPISKNCFLDAYLRSYYLYSDATPFGAMHNFEGNTQNERNIYDQYKLISGVYGFKGKIELLVNNFYKYLELDDLETIIENDCYPTEEKGRKIIGAGFNW